MNTVKIIAGTVAVAAVAAGAVYQGLPGENPSTAPVPEANAKTITQSPAAGPAIQKAKTKEEKAAEQVRKYKDLVGEQKPVVTSLSNQASKATAKVATLEAQLSASYQAQDSAFTNLNTILDTIANLQTQKGQLQSQIAAKNKVLADATAKGKKDKVAETKKQIAQLQASLKNVQSSLDSNLAKRKTARDTYTRTKDKSKELQVKTTEAKAAAETLTTQLAAAQAKLDSATAKLKEAEVEVKRAKNYTAALRNLPVPFPAAMQKSEKDAVFTVGTRNMWVAKAPAVPIAAVIGFQEVNNAMGIAKIKNLKGYDSYIPTTEAHQVPIAWRSDVFRPLAAGSKYMTPARRGWTPSRWVNWVRLEHLETGKQFIFVNTHFVQGAHYQQNFETPWRRAQWNTHLSKIRAEFSELNDAKVPMFLVGDMNYARDLNIAGMRKLDPGRGTIDHIYASAANNVSFGMQERLPKNGSDHHPYKATVTLSWNN